jgi:O-antigen ligase
MNYPENMTLQATVDLPDNIATEKATLRSRFEMPGRVALLMAIIVSPWIYGGYHFSTQAWIAVALLIGLASWWFEAGVSEKKSIVFPYLFIPVGLGTLLVLFQSWPLPDWIGQTVLGDQIRYFKNFSGVPDQWPSISLNRDGTWTQFGQLVMAIAGMCLGCRYFRTTEQMKLLFAVCTINGAALSFFGIIHALTSNTPDRIFWVIELINGGMPFGPYVNRNNAAGYLIICLGCSIGLITLMLAKDKKGPKALGTKDLPFWSQFKLLLLKFISELDAKKLSCLFAAAIISVGIIASLSRGGVLAMLVAMLITLLFYGMARKPNFTGFIFLPVVLLVLFFAGWLGFGEKVIQRFDHVKTSEISQTDVRLQHWIDTWPAVGDTGLFGAGAGAYPGIHRPYFSSKETVVFTHADNHFFQGIVETGWPGFVLLMSAWALAFYLAVFALNQGNSTPSVAAGTAGLFIVVGVGVASFFDFGLYMSANMLLMSVVIGFLSYHAQSLAGRLRKRTWLRFQSPKFLVQLMLLILFAATFVFALDFYRKSKIQVAIREFPASKFSYASPDLANTDRLINKITPLVKETRLTAGLNYVAKLLEHRCRLQQLIAVSPEYRERKKLTEDEELKIQSYWALTKLDLVQENEFYLRREKSPYQANAYRNSKFIRENLSLAANFLEESRRSSPLQPFVQVKLGQIKSIIGNRSEAAADIEAAVAIAPMNGNLRKLAGINYLQAGDAENAAPHLRKYLEFDRRGFKTVMDIISGRSGRRLAPMNDKLVFEKIVPDDSEMLYTLATRYFSEESPYRIRALDKAESLLSDISASDGDLVLLNARVKLAMGDIDGAIDQFEMYLISQPADYNTHFTVANLYYKVGDLTSAEEKLNYIIRMDGTKKKSRYRTLLNKVEAELTEELNKTKSNSLPE